MNKYLTKHELEQVTQLLESAYSFVKNGPAPQLEESLLQYATKLKNTMANSAVAYRENLNCPTCDFENNHIIATLTVEDDDSYGTSQIIVNGKYSISARVKYGFRSQGNIHILFSCESGHFFIKSYDGHKGIVFIDENSLMDELVEYLNGFNKNNEDAKWSFDYEILGQIESFFKEQVRKQRLL